MPGFCFENTFWLGLSGKHPENCTYKLGLFHKIASLMKQIEALKKRHGDERTLVYKLVFVALLLNIYEARKEESWRSGYYSVKYLD
jgi:hypothetical protein